MDAGSSRGGLARDLAAAFLPVIELVVGAAVGWVTITWGVATFRDALSVPDLSPVPVRDRAPGTPGPTPGYWMSWALPLLAVYGAGLLLLWRWRRGRMLVGGALVGLSAAVVLLVPVWMSIEVGGFAPE